jgi:hypothetical protein
MGGERASPTRRREAGKICCICYKLLDAAPPGHKAGIRGERYCEKCQPRRQDVVVWDSDERTHKVHCHVMRAKSWSVTFADRLDQPAETYPWLLFDTADEVLNLLKWGHISETELEGHNRDIKRWRVGGGVLHLTTKQWHQLKTRRVGWPWNGYELQQLKEAENYPPRPLSQAQEEQFLQRRRK